MYNEYLACLSILLQTLNCETDSKGLLNKYFLTTFHYIQYSISIITIISKDM